MEPISLKEASRRRDRGDGLLEEAPADGARRIAVLSTFNADLLRPYLAEALDRIGIDAELYFGGFGNVAEEALDPGSPLHEFAPDDVLVIPAAQDMLAPVFARPAEIPEEKVDSLVELAISDLRAAIEALGRKHPSATCYVVAFGAVTDPSEYVLAPDARERGQVAAEELVAGVRGLAHLGEQVVIVDWDHVVCRAGWDALTDRRLWYLGRMRLGPVGLALLAERFAEHLAAYRGIVRKVLAVDLDGVMWGGVVGEAGLDGIDLGNEGIGLAFLDFQRELLKLRDVGFLITICSKNNPEDAWEVFEKHPDMLLQKDDLAAARISWEDKATGLREMAEELNVGIDSFVFLDDSGVERGWVREALPDVLVPELPEDPVDRPDFLRTRGFLRRISVTPEDLKRADSYRAQRERTELRGETRSYEDFLRSLELEVTVEPVREATASRAAQLAQRTNQFNLTTERHDRSSIESMRQDPDVELYTVAVRDRFGDSGVTGLAILRYSGQQAEIDTFLLSCRVLGRRVEDVLLWFLAERASERGARWLKGRYVPTEKNVQTAEFFPEAGFEQVGEGEFRLDLHSDRPERPDAVTVEVAAHA